MDTKIRKMHIREAVFFALGALAWAGITLASVSVIGQNAQTLHTVSRTTATSTQVYTVPTSETYLFNSEDPMVGACLKVKDTGDEGYTYITTSNGAMTVSKNSCE